MGKSVGIITFHRSYNCGSMMQAYALQTIVGRLGHSPRIINFSNEGQKALYRALFPWSSPKNLIKNLILLPRKAEIKRGYAEYERFISDNFNLAGSSVSEMSELSDDGFDAVIAGSDQVWNVTIEDSDDAYYLPWVSHAKRIAYAPSFGAKNPAVCSDTPELYASYLRDFDALSVRENNGRRWIKDLIGVDVPVLLDPTLLLDAGDYKNLEANLPALPDKYIFYYSPAFSSDINRLLEGVSKKYGMPVIAFNAKHFYVKCMNLTSSFSLPTLEGPAAYLTLIKNASVVFTTSFHGTIFSTIYRKPFWTVKNGGMFGDDDRVLTLVSSLGIENRLCPIAFDDDWDYLSAPNWIPFENALAEEREKSISWLSGALE